MKLRTIKIRNFRGYKDETIIDLSNLTTFIGKNDAGKSTIFEALEIFFNNSLVICEKEDLNIDHDDEDINIEITCIFDNLPPEIILDTTYPTTLENEHLLNADGLLEIKKVYSATAQKPKEKIIIVCNHPINDGVNNLLTLKRAELRKKAQDLSVSVESYNANINSSIRSAIWNCFENLQFGLTELLVDKEDTKKVYESLKVYLPSYALFQTDRQSKDGDKEVADPMKIAVQNALKDLESEIQTIKDRVQQKATETAIRTLSKLREMSPEIAETLTPEFKDEPKFDSIFKLTIKSDAGISINKRGSGVRRLILLNFFRAEVENRRTSNENSVIYAFEEPETSQHPNFQKMLIEAFIELSQSENTQVLLTTHSPALTSLLPLESLRLVNSNNGTRDKIESGEGVYQIIADTLGVLPEPFSNTHKAVLLVEGPGDVVFLKHTSDLLKRAGYITHTFDEKGFYIIPVGGCGTLKYWVNTQLINQFNVPYCVLLDSDKGTNEEHINTDKIRLLTAQGIKAYVTQKREPENYLHKSILGLRNPDSINYSETDNAKKIISEATSTRDTYVLEKFWPRMTVELIREAEQYEKDGDIKYELTEMIQDFISIVE
jgi:hypothetical protein